MQILKVQQGFQCLLLILGQVAAGAGVQGFRLAASISYAGRHVALVGLVSKELELGLDVDNALLDSLWDAIRSHYLLVSIIHHI